MKTHQIFEREVSSLVSEETKLIPRTEENMKVLVDFLRKV